MPNIASKLHLSPLDAQLYVEFLLYLRKEKKAARIKLQRSLTYVENLHLLLVMSPPNNKLSPPNNKRYMSPLNGPLAITRSPPE